MLEIIRSKLIKDRSIYQCMSVWDFSTIELLLKRWYALHGSSARYEWLLSDYVRKTQLPVPRERWVWSFEEIEEMLKMS